METRLKRLQFTLSSSEQPQMTTTFCLHLITNQSKQILSGTSAQLGYTVPFTSAHAGKYKKLKKTKIKTNKDRKYTN